MVLSFFAIFNNHSIDINSNNNVKISVFIYGIIIAIFKIRANLLSLLYAPKRNIPSENSRIDPFESTI